MTGISAIKLRIIIAVIIASIFLFSCEFKNEEELESVACDTINVTYNTVQLIFDHNCVRCHNDQINYLDIKLNTNDNALNAAKTGLLKKAVNHLPGVVPMPFQLPKLEDCEVRKITLWIDAVTL